MDDLPEDYEVCSVCGYDHQYDGHDVDAYEAMKEAHEEES